MVWSHLKPSFFVHLAELIRAQARLVLARDKKHWLDEADKVSQNQDNLYPSNK